MVRLSTLVTMARSHADVLTVKAREHRPAGGYSTDVAQESNAAADALCAVAERLECFLGREVARALEAKPAPDVVRCAGPISGTGRIDGSERIR